MKNKTISFKLPSKWKINIEKRLRDLGVKPGDLSNFYRGAIMAGIGNSLRAKDPSWQKFIKAVSPIAKRKLGVSLYDDGLEGIIQNGTILYIKDWKHEDIK